MLNLDLNLLDSLEKQTYNKSALNLASKKLTDADIKILCSLLTKNPRIIELDLTYNNLTNESAKLLAQNCTLRTLRIKAGNKEITIAGLQVFLNNYTITSLPIIGGSGGDIDNLRAHIKKNLQKPNVVAQTLPIPKLVPDNNEPLITDGRLFPRSEYYTRFAGTTAFAMNDPTYWGTYHRSESSRFFTIGGGRKNVQFTSPLAKKAQGTLSFFAHTGGYLSPFSTNSYAEALSLEKLADKEIINIRDRLLLYKNDMAKIVVKSFEEFQENTQRIGKEGSNTRPIVYAENKYPCVLVALPVLNLSETPTDATKYWVKHKKPFQRLILCSFVAFVNVEAMQEGIPIEIVLRASFGHNVPSICETDNTFRINVGLIPRKYAVLIGKALHELNKAINAITDKTSQPAPFDAGFHAHVRIYNAKKLKKAIDKNKRYENLRNTRDYQKAEHSEEACKRLHESFNENNKSKKQKGKKSNFVPVDLKDKNIWQAIRSHGNSKGGSVLSECFREKGTEDWFINQMMEALLTNPANPIETALDKLLRCLTYGEKVTMNYEKIHRELKLAKREFANPSFEKIYVEDPAFSEMVELLCGAFSVNKPKKALYAELERGGVKLLTTHKASEKLAEEPDFGSDSEFSDDFDDGELSEKVHISYKKLRLCAGMKAILLAHYGALSYLRSQGVMRFDKDIQQMYYEVEGALNLVEINEPMLNRARLDSKVLHFDLNHCNAENSTDNLNLQEKVNTFKPTIVILDWTSSTSLAVKKAVYECLSNKDIEFVICVSSGLKNDQGGLDFNPYGEVRVCAKNRRVIKAIFEMMRKGLSKEDKLSPETHEIVRVCKQKQMALSFYNLFKKESSSSQLAWEKHNSIKV